MSTPGYGSTTTTNQMDMPRAGFHQGDAIPSAEDRRITIRRRHAHLPNGIGLGVVAAVDPDC
jgi:hypothetical protein